MEVERVCPHDITLAHLVSKHALYATLHVDQRHESKQNDDVRAGDVHKNKERDLMHLSSYLKRPIKNTDSMIHLQSIATENLKAHIIAYIL